MINLVKSQKKKKTEKEEIHGDSPGETALALQILTYHTFTTCQFGYLFLFLRFAYFD